MIHTSADSGTEGWVYDERCGRSDIPTLEAWPFSSSSSKSEPSESGELALRFNVAWRSCGELVVVYSLFSAAQRVAEGLACRASGECSFEVV